MKEKESGALSILAFVLSLIGAVFSFIIVGVVLCIAGLIIGIIALIQESKKGFAIGGIACSLLGILICLVMVSVIFDSSETTEELSEETISVPASESFDNSRSEEKTISETEEDSYPEPVIDLYYAELFDSDDIYDGKYVRVSVPIDECCDGYIMVNDGTEYTMYIETDTSTNSTAKYATVVGMVDSSEMIVFISDTTIEYIGDTSPERFEEAKIAFEKARIEDECKQAEAAIAARDNFIAEAQEVSYEDLRRYPDTYNGKRLKLTIHFNTVKPDGWILQGDMFATLGNSNNEIAVYDARTLREPRFMEGDDITVYALGNGLSKVQIKDGTGFLAEVIDEYEIPSIQVYYTDLDNLDALGTSTNAIKDSTQKEAAAEAGKNAAEALNKLFE